MMTIRPPQQGQGCQSACGSPSPVLSASLAACCGEASAPCTWNTCFAMSKPIVVACSMDASFGGSSTTPPWHTDAVGGRPPHHPIEPIPAGIANGRSGAFLPSQSPATSGCLKCPRQHTFHFGRYVPDGYHLSDLDH